MGLLKKIIATKGSPGASTSNEAKRKTREDIARQMYEENLFGYRDLVDKEKYQQALLDKVNAAREQYSKDGDLDSVISVFEEAFITADPPCGSSQWKLLVDYYLKAGLNDKAWSYLQKMSLDNAKELKENSSDEYALKRYFGTEEKISLQKARVLKKEKRFEYAIEFYLVAHVMRIGFGNSFDKGRFFKDIDSCANRLKWDDAKKEHLAYIVQQSARQKLYLNQSQIRSAYRAFLEDIRKENVE